MEKNVDQGMTAPADATPSGSRAAVIAVMAVLAVILFAIDVAMPPGVMDGIGYPSLMLFTLWLPGRKPVIAAAAAFTVLTIVAYTQLQPGGIGEANIVNRVFALALVWLVAVLLLQRKASDQRLRAALRLAETASAAKSKFLATLSHELRTPLNAILGFSESLSMEIFGTLGTQRNRESVKHIHESASHLLALIADLLEFANLERDAEAAEITDVDLRPCLARTLARAAPVAANAQITLRSRAPDDLPFIRGDVRLVEHTLHHLIDNALKFTPAGGWVELRAGAGAHSLWLEVVDSGVGIPEETLRLIGEPFVRAGDPERSAEGGAGLGLAIAKAFTEQQQGALTIKSHVGFGTTVRLTYPRTQLAAGET